MLFFIPVRLVCVMASVVVLQPLVAHAQDSDATYSAELLHEGVLGELIREGTSLARLGLAFEVERRGQDSWHVTLLERSTGAVVEERDVAQLPADQSAAVAYVTVIVTAMVRRSELARRAAPPTPAPAVQPTTEPRAVDIPPPPEIPVVSAEAEEQYAQEFIGFQDGVVVTVGDHSVSSSPKLLAYQGQYKKRLKGAALYRALNRPDLASSYENRRTGRIALMIGGSAIAAGSWAVGYLTAEKDEDCELGNDFGGCVDRNIERGKSNITRIATIGIVGSGIGLLMVYLGKRMDPHPISSHEIRALGDEHNRQLREQLGLPADHQARPVSRGRSLKLAPYALADGGGLTVLGRF